jgi:hypothetical protein
VGGFRDLRSYKLTSGGEFRLSNALAATVRSLMGTKPSTLIQFEVIPDLKIIEERENLCGRMQFRRSNQTRIRQRHGSVAVTVHKRPQARLFLLNIQSDSDGSPLQQRKERIGFVALPFQKKDRFRKHWFAR